MPNTDLTPLEPQACKDFPEKGKTKMLIGAYEIAAEEHDLDYFKAMLADHQRAMQEDAKLRAERDAKKQKKGKRKSTDAADEGEDVDMEDVGEAEAGDEGADSKPKSKKRKKSMDSEGEAEKVRSSFCTPLSHAVQNLQTNILQPAKTPKTATKLKLSTPKTPATDSASKKKAGSSAKATKSKGSSTKKSNAQATGSDDELDNTPKVPEKALTPQEAKEKKEKEG